MPGRLYTMPKALAWDNGTLLPGAKLTFSQTGTSTPQNTYSDEDLTTAHANPVVADSEGVFPPIYLDPNLPDYRVTYTDSDDVQVYQVDDVPSSVGGSRTLTLSHTAPYLELDQSDASSGKRRYRWIATGDQLILQLGNDAGDTWADVIATDRTANNLDTLTFTADDVIISGALTVGGISILGGAKVKTGTETKAEDTVLADDSHLAGWSLTAGKLYSIEAYLDVEQDGGDIKFLFQFSNAPQQSSMNIYSQDETGVEYTTLSVDITAQEIISTMTDADRYGLRFTGLFVANATTGGTVDFQWAQNTSDTDFTSIYFGSWMKITQLN